MVDEPSPPVGVLVVDSGGASVVLVVLVGVVVDVVEVDVVEVDVVEVDVVEVDVVEVDVVEVDVVEVDVVEVDVVDVVEVDVVEVDVVVVGEVVHTPGGGASTGWRTTLVATPVCTSKMPPVVCDVSKNTIGSAALSPTTDPRFWVVPVNRYCPPRPRSRRW